MTFLTGFLAACASGPKAPEVQTPRAVTVTVPAPAASSPPEAPIAEAAPAEPVAEPVEEPEVEITAAPELVAFVRSELEGIICEDGFQGARPEIRGVIEGDGIAAVAVRFGPDRWSFTFKPGLNARQSRRVVKFRINPNLDISLTGTGGLRFQPGDIQDDDGTGWLLGKMQADGSWDNLEIGWQAEEGEQGLKPSSDCTSALDE